MSNKYEDQVLTNLNAVQIMTRSKLVLLLQNSCNHRCRSILGLKT